MKMLTYKEIKEHITISPKNMKVDCPNIGLPPIKTCDKSIGCYKTCYAMKSFRLYPDVKNAYEKNLATYLKSPEFYFYIIDQYLKKKKPKFFRWQVSGDIVASLYLKGMIIVAKKNPEIRFLAFTKKYDIALKHFEVVPENLCLVLSSWIDTQLPEKHFYPIAFYQDGTETRQYNYDTCEGSCYTCKKCWFLHETGKNVLFHKH